MYQQNICLDAIETVLAWNIPDELLSDAIQSQVCLMACLAPEDGCVSD